MFFVALDNEEICSLLFVKDNHCSGSMVFDELTEQFSQSALYLCSSLICIDG